MTSYVGALDHGTTSSRFMVFDREGRVVAAEQWKRELETENWDGRFLRSREFVKYLENEYNLTRAVLVDLGLAR